MQKAEPHDAAAPSGAHKAKANESSFTVPPERWNCRKTTTLRRIQRQEETGGARGGKGVSGQDRGGTAVLKTSNGAAIDRCKGQAAGAMSIMPGSKSRVHDRP